MKEIEMRAEFLQPWSTFVMKTKLPPEVIEKMIRITDEIVEKRIKNDPVAGQLVDGQGNVEDQFLIETEILEREKLMEFFSDVCRHYVIQAFCQFDPFNKENILKDKWKTQILKMWINSQKDNEYFPMHDHINCALSSVMYLKIPEYLPARRYSMHNSMSDGGEGSITFVNNVSKDKIWGRQTMMIQPQVGDFFIFPASQIHQVYPFMTPDGKGERRSVSFNAGFASKSEYYTNLHTYKTQ